jgi:putative ABC transport system permease protein
MDTLQQDLRYAVRTLRRAPGFTAAAVVALALGIGACTAIFSVVDAVLLRPPPYPAGDRLTVLWEESPERGARYNEIAPANYRAVRDGTTAFDRLAAWDFADYTLADGAAPERIRGLVVEPHLLAMVGATAAAGRLFTADEAAPGAADVVLLGHDFWQRRFDGDPAIIGRSLLLDGRPTVVAGVLPADFYFGAPADVYAPLVLDEAAWQDRQQHWLRVVGRLAPGVAIEDAAAELRRIADTLERTYPATNAGWGFSIHRFNAGMTQGPMAPTLLVLLGAVAFVLLIACADVANLLLARGAERARELGVRTALGAGRARVARQLVTESLVLAFAGGALGALFAVWGVEALRAGLPPIALAFTPSLADLRVDARALLFILGLSVTTGMLFGTLPALRAVRVDLTTALRQTGATAGSRHRRLRSTLVAAEIALALVLLTGGITLMRSFVAQLGAHGGIRADLTVLWLRLPQPPYDASRLHTFQATLLDRFAALPAIESVGFATAHPLSGEDHRRRVSPAPHTLPDDRLPLVSTRAVSAGYLPTLGVAVLAGRDVRAADRTGAAPVALVSRTLADRFFPDGAVGRHIRVADDTLREIVGVVADVPDWRLAARDDAMIYLPLAQFAAGRFAIVMRTRGTHDDAVRDLRAALHALEPDQPLFDIRSMRAIIDESTTGQRIGSVTMSIFAAVALLLALVGVYGVMAYTVNQRIRELGIRIALGAAPGDLRSLVLRQGLAPVCAGLAAGLVLAFFLARALAAGIAPDAGRAAPTVAVTAVLLLAAALAALAIPVRRAARVDPLTALRAL